MRFFSVLLALIVGAVLYLLVFERERVLAFAAGEDVEVSVAETAPVESERTVSVVAMRSHAQAVDSAVLIRGQTEAARQVDVRAETSGRVVSEPLRKGANVEAGQLLCQIDEGTRGIALMDARARYSEAETRVPEAEARIIEANARLPEAEARLAEAQARLTEAEINDRAAQRLSEGGFASETRVASTQAAVESAKAGVQAAKSGVEAARAGVSAAKTGVETARAGVLSAAAGVAAAEKELERLSIKAPFNGLLESDSAEIGSLLQPGLLCATVIQLDPIKLVGFVPETEVDKVRVGAVAGARLSSGREVAAKVTFLSRSADPTTRTFRVEVAVPNPDLAIRDGQTVEIGVAADGARAHLLPSSAMTLNDAGVLGVRLVGDESRAAFRPITILRDYDRWRLGLGASRRGRSHCRRTGICD